MHVFRAICSILEPSILLATSICSILELEPSILLAICMWHAICKTLLVVGYCLLVVGSCSWRNTPTTADGAVFV